MPVTDAIQAIRYLLAHDDDVLALVSTRIYPMERPQGSATPAIAFALASADHLHSTTGSCGTSEMQLTVTCYATLYRLAVELADAVRRAIDGFSGYVDAIRIHHCLLIDEANELEPAAGIEQRATYSVRQLWQIDHSEVLPST